MNIFKKIFARGVEKKFETQDNAKNNYFKALFGFDFRNIFSPYNDFSYLDTYKTLSTVYACVERISKASTKIPLRVYKIKNRQEKRKYEETFSRMIKTGKINTKSLLAIKEQAFDEIDNENDYLVNLLKQPNEDQSWEDFLHEFLMFKLVTGNGYIYGNPSIISNKRFSELRILPSQYVRIVSGGVLKPIDHYCLNINAEIHFEKRNILHIKNPNPDYNLTGNQLYGLSPLSSVLLDIDANRHGKKSQSKLLANFDKLGMLSPKAIEGGGLITSEQMANFADKFRKSTGMFITNLPTDYYRFGFSARELELTSQINLSQKEIANIYHVPVQLLNNTDTSSYNNISEFRKAILLDAVIPELIKLSNGLNRFLLPLYGKDYFIEFDFSEIPELVVDQSKLVSSLEMSWWLTGNEKREQMGFDYIEDERMNEIYIPNSLSPLSDPILEDVMNDDPIEQEDEQEPED